MSVPSYCKYVFNIQNIENEKMAMVEICIFVIITFSKNKLQQL